MSSLPATKISCPRCHMPTYVPTEVRPAPVERPPLKRGDPILNPELPRLCHNCHAPLPRTAYVDPPAPDAEVPPVARPPLKRGDPIPNPVH